MSSAVPVSIAVPTYRRERVLLDTIGALLGLQVRAAEILILDQTESHEEATARQLEQWHTAGLVRWFRLPRPSIPAAMNHAICVATQPVVLFLDDDIVPDEHLVDAHWRAHQAHPDAVVAGKVLQPWDEGRDHPPSAQFHFASNEPCWISQFMGGNVSLRRDVAMALGGFDENFVRVAYRFEAEFAHRVIAGGHRIRFEPAACIHHLKVSSGGTRTYGEHLTTWRPDHAVGAYYYGLQTGDRREFAGRPWRSIATRYHLTHPWQIPVTLLAEAAGVLWAFMLYCRGPRRLREGASKTHD